MLGCAGLAAATFPGVMGARAQKAADETTGRAGPMSVERAPFLLSDEERHRVYQELMRFPDAGKAPLDVADKVPATAPLQDLPASLTAGIALLRDHKFIKLDDRILLVEPASRVVVAMIPRYKLMP
jgi:hypothetical protein